MTPPQSAGRELDAMVRRITPKECERLQGFPDDYTLVPYRVNQAQAETTALRDIDFTDNQGDMFANECEGHCGL